MALTVSRVVKGGENVVKEIVYIHAEALKIALRHPGQIGAVLISMCCLSGIVASKINGKHVGATLNQV